MDMTRDKILEKLQLMYDLADQEDLKTVLDVSIGAIRAADDMVRMALDPHMSDAKLGATIRAAILASLLGGTPDET